MVRMWLGFHRRSLTYTLCGVSLVVIGWTCANPAILGKFHFHSAPRRTTRSRATTVVSVSSRQRYSAPCSGRVGRFEHARARLANGVRSCGTESMLLSQRMAFFLSAFHFLYPDFSLCLQYSKWPLAGEDFQGQCPSKQRAFLLSGPPVAAPRVAPALSPCLPLFVLPCGDRRLCGSPCHGSTSGLGQPSGGNASSSRSPSLAGISTSRPTSPCRVVVCACALPHHARRALNALCVTAMAFSQPCQQARCWRLPWRFAPAPPRQYGQHPPRVGLVPPGPLSPLRPIYPCLVATPFLALSRRHAAPRCPYPPPSAIPIPLLIASLCFPTRSRSSEMAAS